MAMGSRQAAKAPDVGVDRSRSVPWRLGGALLLLAALACEGRPRAGSADGGAPAREPRSGPAVAVIDLADGVPEQPPSGPLGLPSRRPTMEDMVREVERLSREKELHGVLVRFGTASIGLARAAEIGTMLASLAKKTPVWCHADDLGNATLYAAARACTRIWLSPAGSVGANGIAAQVVYFHQLLADELGLSVDFLQVGKYKGAEEPFTRDGPSPEARASLESTLADMRASWLASIVERRAGAPATPGLAGFTPDAPEDGPYAAPTAKQRGLVDDVGYFDEARDALEKAAGAVRAEVRFGSGAQGDGGADLGDVLRVLAGESLGAAPVAVVRAIGAISMDGGGGPLGGGGGIVEKKLVRTLARLEKDDEVKAVVLRIDSPGGSALASDLLWHALMKIRARKPLVVSIGSMAASGGQYLASSGSVVFADEASIVGSIGVVGGKIAADKALAKIGVHAETFPAKTGDAKAAARAAYESLLVPWDDATRARLLETMTGIYELFLARVAEGRRIDVEKVKASAEGRIFSGREGKTRSLVDEIGGLRDAIARARSLAGLAADARFSVAGEASGILEALAADDEPPPGVAQAAWREAISRVAPQAVDLVESLAPLAEGEHTLCAVPFGIEVR